jgi:hypothetical protein
MRGIALRLTWSDDPVKVRHSRCFSKGAATWWAAPAVQHGDAAHVHGSDDGGAASAAGGCSEGTIRLPH